MNNTVFTCKYSPDIESKAVRQLLILSILAAEMRLGQEAQERDGRYRLDEKERLLEIDTATGFGKTMARLFSVLIAEMFVEGEYHLTETGSQSEQGQHPARGGSGRRGHVAE